MSVILDSVANFVKLNVVGSYSSSSTVITIQAGQTATLPSAPFNMTWWNSTAYFDPADDPNREIVRCTAVNTPGADQITVLRGQEGTAASNKNTAGAVYLMILGITAKMITDIQSGLQKPFQFQPLAGLINSINTVYTFSPAPTDLNSPNVSLGRQPQIMGVDITVTVSGSNGQVIYMTPPDQSLNGQPHVIQYI